MSLHLDENNGDNGFELVDRPRDNESAALAPSALPATPVLSASNVALPQPMPIFLPPTQIPGDPSGNIPATVSFSATPSVQAMAPPTPLFLPVSTTSAESLIRPASFELPILETSAPTTYCYSPDTSHVPEEPLKQTGGLFGWMSGLPGKGLLTKVAEKARSSVDTLVTTLDPQMKEFLQTGGDIDIVVASTKENKLGAVREAFQTIFGKATVRPCESQSSSVAAQPVGFASSFQAAEERLAYLRSSRLVHEQVAAVAVEGFVVELYPGNWFEMACLVLHDPSRNIKLHSYTQPISIPTTVVNRMKNATTAAYPFRQSGYLLTVGQAIAEELQVPTADWQLQLSGVSRRELIYLGAKSLAFAYKTARETQY